MLFVPLMNSKINKDVMRNSELPELSIDISEIIKTTKANLDKNFLRKHTDKQSFKIEESHFHRYGKNLNRCVTDSRGYSTPGNRSGLKLVVHAGDGFIPLWQQGVALRWKFNEASLEQYRDPLAAAEYIRNLFALGIYAWQDAVPIKFVEHKGLCDFEIHASEQSQCDSYGCTLASAFFPNSGQNRLFTFPSLFEQTEDEQVETMIHELGHVFGLRHFFALIDETYLPSVQFGEHNRFSIMNYGQESMLTIADIADLKELYRQVWSDEINHINGTQIRLVEPFHRTR
jgi:hypothetical protein